MNYPGGKNGSGTYQRIINQIPPHKYYYELFLGSGAILAKKKPAAASVAIDLDPAAIQAWEIDPPVNIPNLHLHNRDAIQYLKENLYRMTPDCFVYLDPPYPISSRSSQREIYNCEMTDDQHRDLLQTITDTQIPIAISTYPNNLYQSALSAWRVISFETVTRGGGQATELLYMNYPEPTTLHDYNYLGDDYRERERIKKKIKRWKNKLANMNRLERQAILAAIEESGSYRQG